MHLRDFVESSLVLCGLAPDSKQGLLTLVADRAAGQLPGVDRDTLAGLLLARERESSTGVGQGVAIPHCFIEGLKGPHCVLVQVPGGVDFDAIDEAPVHILFVLVSPPDARMTHLRLLARISRIASRKGFAADAAACGSPEELHELVEREDRSHAG